jgi:hypothetical protein
LLTEWRTLCEGNCYTEDLRIGNYNEECILVAHIEDFFIRVIREEFLIRLIEILMVEVDYRDNLSEDTYREIANH